MRKVRLSTLSDEVLHTLIADKSIDVFERAFALNNIPFRALSQVHQEQCKHAAYRQLPLLNALIALAFGCMKQKHIVNSATAIALTQHAMHLLGNTALNLGGGRCQSQDVNNEELSKLPYVSTMLFNQALLLYADYPQLQEGLVHVMGQYAQGGVLSQERLHILKDYMYLVHLQLAALVKFALQSGHYLAKHQMDDDETRILGFNIGMVMQINEDVSIIQHALPLTLLQLKTNVTWFLLDEKERQEESVNRLQAMQAQPDIIAQAHILADLYATQAMKLLNHWVPENIYKARICKLLESSTRPENVSP